MLRRRGIYSGGHIPSHLRSMRTFPGRIHARYFHAYHFTDPEAFEAIKQSKRLFPGLGNLGFGWYFTKMHPKLGFSIHELKVAVRNPNLPNDKISRVIGIDTDHLGRNFQVTPLGTVFIEAKEGDVLDLSSLSSTFEATPGIKD